MKFVTVFLFSLALLDPAAGVPAVPQVDAGDASWNAFTAQAITAGDFAAWRDALAERLRADLPPAAIAKVDTAGAALALAQWMFLRDVLAADANALTQVAAAAGGKDFLKWLLANHDALDDYNGIAAVFGTKGKRTTGIDGWREIWNTCPDSRTPGLWRRVATACAIAFADNHGPTSPRERFAFYRQSHAAGQLVPYFDQAPPFELALVVHGANRGNDDLEWAQDVTPKDQQAQGKVGNYGHSLIAYRGDNYRGQTVQGPEYYDHKPADLCTAMEYGGVCGMISHTNVAVTVAHGVPAFTVGQPGHCAYVWKSDAKTWSGGNFISGWPDTHDSHQQPFWLSQYSANINLVSAAVDSPGFVRAEHLRALGAVWRLTDPQKSCEMLAAATTADAYDYSAWCDRIEAALAWDKTPTPLWKTLAAELVKALPKYPVALNDLLARFDSKQLVANCPDAEKLSLATAAARALTGLPPNEQWDLIYPVWKPWLARQLTIFGVPPQQASAAADGNAQNAAAIWLQIPQDQRPQVEALFAALLPVVEKNGTLFKGVAAAWLALVAGDDPANTRAAKHFQAKLATAKTLAQIEMLADALLTAARTTADARADLATRIRKLLSNNKEADPAHLDALLALLAQHDFRDANRIGEWKPGQFAKSGDQTADWDLTRTLEKAAGEYTLHLNFRWTGGAPLSIKSVRLFADDRELVADTHAATADSSLRPAVYALRLPKAQPGVRYVIRATAAGGADSAGAVLSRAEPAATFQPADWAGIGGWGGKEIQAAPEITAGWHEMEFDASKILHTSGPVFVMFKYDSYSCPRIMNVRLLVDGREVATELHSCNPMAGANNMYALRLPPATATTSPAKITIRALFSQADGWGTVFVRKQPG